ncbi:MAG: EAL domain-containing protein [Synechococcaceae cyanobacterium SM1_2_3]|nr:EAL domain-containing protein [Synechococcaceae cyanobacterium SM1_2_3]
MNTDAPLRILFVEDVPADAELAVRMLRKQGLSFTSIRVESRPAFLKALAEYQPALVISDYSMPQFDGMCALHLVLQHDANLPFIILTGSINEETAVDCIKAGAWDYVLKERMTRLPFAVNGALERKRNRIAQAEAEMTLHLQSIALQAAANAIVITNQDGLIEWINPAFSTLTGYSLAEASGKNPSELLSSGRHDIAFYQSLWDTILAGRIWRGELINRRKDGSLYPEEQTITPVYDKQGQIQHFVAIKQDISERKIAEAQIHRLAYYDALTGLPNQRLFLDRLNQSLAAARRSGYWGAVLLVDLDQFKRVNDARGHEIGDLLIKQAGERISNDLRDEDTVARQGGDEFAVLLVNLATTHPTAIRRASRLAEKIRAALDKPFRIGAADYHISASIGVTIFPKAVAESVDDLLREADTALYRAKEAGRNSVSYFEPAMQEAVQARFALEHDLRQALARGEMRLFLQPQVDRQGRWVGAEALVRWERPGHGLVSPALFIPVAEESGIIVTLGRWVLEEACRLLKQLDAAGHRLRVAVNVSPRQFRQPDFSACVREVLDYSGADSNHLVLEVTEGLVIENIHDTVAKMMELNCLGIEFSIDDFGTGYSSLAYLKQLPLHELKIDRTFVQDAPTDPNDAALVEAILAVARHLKLSVVAEGVETETQLDFLKQRGCEIFQGYYFDRPLPWPQFEEKARLQMGG